MLAIGHPRILHGLFSLIRLQAPLACFQLPYVLTAGTKASFVRLLGCLLDCSSVVDDHSQLRVGTTSRMKKGEVPNKSHSQSGTKTVRLAN